MILFSIFEKISKFSGATTLRMKLHGKGKIYGKTTPTCFLANPNLEGEIHLKGGRFVTSQIFNLECYTQVIICISYFVCILVVILEILSNSRTQGESWRFHKFSYLNFFKFEKRINLVIIFFSPIISNIKNKREKII